LAYWIAVGALGVALVAFLIGAAVIAAGGKPVPTQYWATGSAISGAIIGIVAPAPTRGTPSRESRVRRLMGWFGDAVADLWNNRALLILSAVFAASLTLAVVRNSAPLETVAAAAGGALIGLLAPPPAQQGQ
jgi:Na+/melibiose symporter-like transporter